MGQAPATGRLSLRTVPRNFPGRSGAVDDQVCLVSPETAAASALDGRDHRSTHARRPIPVGGPPRGADAECRAHRRAADRRRARRRSSKARTSSESLPLRPPREDHVLPVLLKLGRRRLDRRDPPRRSSCAPAPQQPPSHQPVLLRARSTRPTPIARKAAHDSSERLHGEHAIVAGRNYGQGSSREHAALAPAYLGTPRRARAGLRPDPHAEPRQLRCGSLW